MKIKKLVIPMIAIVMLALTLAAPVSAADSAPSLPHYFYGTVMIEGDVAPVGTLIEAKADGVVYGAFNPITITETGKYGSTSPLADVPRLLVQGDIADGATVEFFVNGVKAIQTASWHEAQVETLNLTVTTTAISTPNPVTQTTPLDSPFGLSWLLVGGIGVGVVLVGWLAYSFVKSRRD